MMDWLLASIDPSRGHEVGFAVSWHARTMTLAWGILAPLAVLIARYLKVLPGQDWPRQLDSVFWWRFHWIAQSLVLLLTIGGTAVVWNHSIGGSLHGRLGYAVLVLVCGQVLHGVFRGTKGGPTAPARDGTPRGDHYDMTPWRIMFEWAHKLLGYTLIALAAVTIAVGLWHANAPNWMWLTIAIWWSVLIAAAIVLQRRGWARDTYQAIWGPSLDHPGNRRKPIGWGINRSQTRQPGE